MHLFCQRNTLKYIYTLFLIIAFLTGCNKDTPESKIYNLKGAIQKGPMIKGSTITISELNKDLSSTGKSFTSTITDDKGIFELSGAELSNSIVSISADGFFFNEVNGTLSNSRIVLTAIVDLGKTTNINVNILTTLENERVKYLLQQGIDFDKAKIQARDNVLNIFGFTLSSNINPEMYDITQLGNENSMLLAISAIVLGTHTEAELTELISGISTDLITDGKLDDPNLQSRLINEAKFLNCSSIRINLSSRYQTLGENISTNDFGQYVESFISTTNYKFTKAIEYPGTVNSMKNILSNTFTTIESSTLYCVAAKLPKGTSLKVNIKPTSGYSSVGIGILTFQNIGWTIISPHTENTILEATGVGAIISIPFMVNEPTSVSFFLYENGSTIPTKTIIVKN